MSDGLISKNEDGAALDGCRAEGDARITTSFDASGHTDLVDQSGDIDSDIDYLYDADGSVIARTTKDAGTDPKTTYYFYFGLTRALAEETTPAGRTKARYLVSSTGEALAQERYDVTGVGAVDDADPGTWTWLLKDAHGSVATHVRDDGTVTKQASYDPYGAPDQGGTSGGSSSTLGFQSAHTDDVTGNMLLGSRIYDPKIDRFTTSDFFVGSGSDLSLGTDPLTGNRYLFAAANPVAFYDDGHRPLKAGHEGSTTHRCKPVDCGRDDEYVMFYPNEVPSNPRGDELKKAASLTPILGTIIDANDCFSLGGWSCFWAAASIIPGGKFLKYADEAVDGTRRLLRLPVDQAWGNASTLDRHFRDHAAEFGASSVEDYVGEASSFLQRGLQQGLPTKVDADGIIRIYDAATNTFGAYNPSGTIRTFFKPSSSTYWSRQPGTSP